MPWTGRIKHALTHYVIICPSKQKSDNVEASHFFTAQNIGPLACQKELYPVRYVVSKKKTEFFHEGVMRKQEQQTQEQ